MYLHSGCAGSLSKKSIQIARVACVLAVANHAFRSVLEVGRQYYSPYIALDDCLGAM